MPVPEANSKNELNVESLQMITIIIPTYNEAAVISDLIQFLKKETSGESVEIIVTDGGSKDKTIELAEKAGANQVISTSRGRAAQMNIGARHANGQVLYFVHADTLPPKGFANHINRAISEGYDFGRYRTKFRSNKLILRLNAFFTRFDWFLCYGGDQTLFVKTEIFEKINGFNSDMLIMEDYDFVKRAKLVGRYKILNQSALVSARKYQNNSWLKVQIANKKIVDMYKKGASQHEMVSKYKQLLDYR